MRKSTLLAILLAVAASLPAAAATKYTLEYQGMPICGTVQKNPDGFRSEFGNDFFAFPRYQKYVRLGCYRHSVGVNSAGADEPADDETAARKMKSAKDTEAEKVRLIRKQYRHDHPDDDDDDDDEQ